MLKIYNTIDAKKSILQRNLEPPTLPDSMQAGMIRFFGEPLTAVAAVQRIIKDVQKRGDTAVRHWTATIDGIEMDNPFVSTEEMAAGAARIDPELLEAMRFSAGRIRAFHSHQPLPSWTTDALGGKLGQKMTPLSRVGVYVPGGSAPLPSSLLMTAIPAQVAGVPEIIVATPPGRPDGRVPDIILAAAHGAGITQMVRIGGAQAIAAMALGTETIPRVDKVAGAGNIFVTLAKKELFGQVGLDGLFGPTETVVIADDSADPAWVAADLLAQAEHDLLATALLFTPSRKLAEAVQIEVGRQLEDRDRADIIASSLADQGGAILTADIAEAVALADAFAPEHMCLAVENMEHWQEKITHAGGLFLGERSFEVLGDYAAGPSHIMPTSGTARFASPLNCLDFVRLTSIIQLDDGTSAELSPIAAKIATAEGLDGHAQAATFRAGDGAPIAQMHTDGGGNNQRSSVQSVYNLSRPHIAKLTPYMPIVPFDVLATQLGRKPEEIVKVDANENPYGLSPKAITAVADSVAYNIYPDPESRKLREALAGFTAVAPPYLLAGAGADELIDLILRAILEVDDIVLNCPPSFGMYPFSAEVNAGAVQNIARRPDFSLDIEAITLAAKNPRAKILFLCSPNNPSGNLISDDALRQVLELPLLVVLDEAYIEFAGTDGHIKWVMERENLVVLRTFSKWAGLAGLRVGYGAFPLWLIEQLWKIKQPYNVNVAAQQAALASLADLEWLWANVERLKMERTRLLALLETISFLKPTPSAGNFILCRVEGMEAKRLKARLAEAGILVRYFDTPLLQNYIRISIGKPQDTDAVIAELQKIHAG